MTWNRKEIGSNLYSINMKTCASYKEPFQKLASKIKESNLGKGNVEINLKKVMKEIIKNSSLEQNR